MKRSILILAALVLPARWKSGTWVTAGMPTDPFKNFNDAGYLTIGFCGSQPETADWYTNNGSLYLTSLCLMPLGLPASHPFWTDAPQPWTQVKAWGGQPFPRITAGPMTSRPKTSGRSRLSEGKDRKRSHGHNCDHVTFTLSY